MLTYGIPILPHGCQASLQWKAEVLAAVTHLALLGVKKQENGILGLEVNQQKELNDKIEIAEVKSFRYLYFIL